MMIPLISDEKDTIWYLFGLVIKVIDSRSFQEDLVRNGLKSNVKFRNMLKIILLSIFFQKNISEVYDQIINSSKLLKFLKIKKLGSLKSIYELYSRHNDCNYLELTLKSLNKLKFKRIRSLNAIILDSTPITLDLKFDGKFLSKQKLLKKDYKRGYSTNIEHYAGFQMTLAIEQETCKPIAILIHPGSPHDTKIFDDMMNELKRRRILRKRQVILADKGFYSLNNYLIGINKYYTVSLLFPKKKPYLITLIERIQNPIDYCGENNEEKGFIMF
ncbi:MAG: transposase [Methanobrevibacter sp.]|nr:transposase [Candidatus Methanoflexus mossambicus]